MLKEGDKAPEFELPSDDGKTIRLRDYKGRKVVMYFYPRDNTPGCTREAQAFAAASKAFAQAGATVLGVSKDSIASHCSFRDKYKLNFPLLSDADLAVHKAYGAFGEKMMYGKKVQGVIRSTFVIGPDGRLAKVFPSVKVDGHADQVLAALGAAGAGGKSAEKGVKKVVKAASAPAPKRAAKAKPAKKAPKKAAAKRPAARAKAGKRR